MSGEIHDKFRQIRGGMDCASRAFWPCRHSFVSWKKRIDQFPTIVKENSTQIRRYQEIVSELIGIFKEHDFLHELNSQVPKATVAKLPARLCGRWAEFVEGKPKLSTRDSFANWLEKRQKSVSPSSGGCQRRESGGVQIHLKLKGVSQPTNHSLSCL